MSEVVNILEFILNNPKIIWIAVILFVLLYFLFPEQIKYFINVRILKKEIEKDKKVEKIEGIESPHYYCKHVNEIFFLFNDYRKISVENTLIADRIFRKQLSFLERQSENLMGKMLNAFHEYLDNVVQDSLLDRDEVYRDYEHYVLFLKVEIEKRFKECCVNDGFSEMSENDYMDYKKNIVDNFLTDIKNKAIKHNKFYKDELYQEILKNNNVYENMKEDIGECFDNARKLSNESKIKHKENSDNFIERFKKVFNCSPVEKGIMI